MMWQPPMRQDRKLDNRSNAKRPSRRAVSGTSAKYRSCQRHHPAPELLALGGIDVVFACEGEPAVVADAIDHDAGGERLDLVAFAHGQRADARRGQQPAARIDAEGAQVDALAVDGLDQLRLARLQVDGENRDVVLAAVEHLLALEFDLALVAVGEIDETAVGMDVDRA